MLSTQLEKDSTPPFFQFFLFSHFER